MLSVPADKLPILQAFDLITKREGSNRSKAIMKYVESYVKMKAKTPNPQTILTVRPYPNLWSHASIDWAEFSTDDLKEMDDLGAPNFQALQHELAKRSGPKRRNKAPTGYEAA